MWKAEAVSDKFGDRSKEMSKESAKGAWCLLSAYSKIHEERTFLIKKKKEPDCQDLKSCEPLEVAKM